MPEVITSSSHMTDSTSGVDMELKDKITEHFLFVEMHTMRSITM